MNSALEDYIETHIDPQPGYLSEIEREANLRLVNGRMCSGHLQGRLLKMLVGMIAPQRVLELGTFAGFSALCMAEALPASAELHTVEVDDELEDFIRRNLSRSPEGKKVELHIGDAMELTASFPEKYFDLIFLDADKQRYPEYYPLCMSRIRPGGYLLADNTLWDGHVVEAGREHDRQTVAIKRFNDIVAADPQAQKVILPLRDGLTIIRKIAINDSTTAHV